ncbi:ABC transporter permease [Spirulina subsalsa]|uniref:ABC transporter permease n=1 Tax=Spirulina subsalsa TaxID=54311 RepID=UPI0002DB0157|nr:ABC transporter permease [Spirulina subsalsa]
MLEGWLDWLGDRNPQLFRELKGRLKPRNILLAVGASLMGQLLLVLLAWQRFENFIHNVQQDSAYCQASSPALHQLIDLNRQNQILTEKLNQAYGIMEADQATINALSAQLGEVQEQIQQLAAPCPPESINTVLWWVDQTPSYFATLTLISLVILLVGGVYLLIQNLEQEEKKGTLTFLRLCPQSTPQLMLGKLLGVPIVLYFALACALPLHVGLAQLSGIPLGVLLLFYGVCIAGCGFFLTGGILVGLLTQTLQQVGFKGFQAIGGAFGMAIALSSLFGALMDYQPEPSAMMIFHLLNPFAWCHALMPQAFSFFNSTSSWFDPTLSGDTPQTFLRMLHFYRLPIGSNPLLLALFLIANALFWRKWLGGMIERCFRNPNGSLLSKRQWYGLMLSFQIIFLGLVLVPRGVSEGDLYLDDLFWTFFLLILINTFLLVWAILTLTPRRQTAIDWARYHHQKSNTGLVEWLEGEKSPALGAIALLLLIAAIFFLPWLWLMSHHISLVANPNVAPKLLVLVAGVAFYGLWLLIYASITQHIFLFSFKQPHLWAFVVNSSIFFFPPLLLTILESQNNWSDNRGIWQFSSLPWVYLDSASPLTLGLSLLTHTLIAAVLAQVSLSRIRYLGKSTTQTLLNR